MADTNASGYSVDEYEITSIELGEDECVVTLGYGASGDQHEDRMYLGETIRGEAVAVVDDRQHVTYRDVSAEVVHSDEDLEDIPSFAGAIIGCRSRSYRNAPGGHPRRESRAERSA
jgi:hypothetical protein